MKSKIIIHNYLDNDLLAIRLVDKVMDKGKISGEGESYCYLSVYYNTIVTCDKHGKNTFTFKVYKE